MHFIVFKCLTRRRKTFNFLQSSNQIEENSQIGAKYLILTSESHDDVEPFPFSLSSLKSKNIIFQICQLLEGIIIIEF